MSKGYVEIGGELFEAELDLGSIPGITPAPAGQPSIYDIKTHCARCNSICESRTLHDHFLQPYCESCKIMLNSILRSQ